MAEFVHSCRPPLRLSDVYDLNGVKTGVLVRISLSEELIIGLADQLFKW